MIDVTKIGHIGFYGQSLSIGARSTEVSTTQPYNNLTFSDGVRGDTPPAAPLVEANGESPVSGTANYLTELYNGGNPVFFGTTSGHSGRTIEQLAKGSVFYTNNIIRMLDDAETLVDYPAALCWVQGEANSLLSPVSGYYYDRMVEMASNMRGDFSATYNYTGDIPFITYQTSSRSLVTEHVVLDQLAFAGSANATLSTPTYFMEYEDGIHLSGNAYRILGNYFAKAIYDQDMGITPYIKPLSAFGSDTAKLTVAFEVPYAPLVLDSTGWVTQDHGFRVYDSDGDITINNITISGNNVVLAAGSMSKWSAIS